MIHKNQPLTQKTRCCDSIHALITSLFSAAHNMTSVCVIARNPEPVGRISHRGMSLSSSCMLFFIVIIILCGKVRYCIIRFYIHSGQTKNWKQSARKGRRTQTRTSERKKRPHLVLFSSLFWCLNVILYSPSCCSKALWLSSVRKSGFCRIQLL